MRFKLQKDDKLADGQESGTHGKGRLLTALNDTGEEAVLVSKADSVVLTVIKHCNGDQRVYTRANQLHSGRGDY